VSLLNGENYEVERKILLDALDKRDAEIARLKKLNLMTDDQVVLELKEEIERLKASFKTVNDLLNDRRQQNADQHKLIGQLADWLEVQAMEHMGSEYKEALDLIKRARETVKP
jgi:hypothetical protein